MSFSKASTPTSIFRRLKTSSPEDAAEQHRQCKFDSFAYRENVNPNSIAFAQAPSSHAFMAPFPQKRSRAVQRGIHPAEINKRITGANDSWQILDIVNTFGAEFDAVNVATALHRIAKQRPEGVVHLTSSDAFQQLVIMVDVQVGTFYSVSSVYALLPVRACSPSAAPLPWMCLLEITRCNATACQSVILSRSVPCEACFAG